MGKHYQKLGYSKPVRIALDTEQWCKHIVRILDTKEKPEEVMALLIEIAKKVR